MTDDEIKELSEKELLIQILKELKELNATLNELTNNNYGALRVDQV